MRTNSKTIAAGIGAAGLLGLGLYLAVPAAADDPSPSPATSPSAPARTHPERGKAHPDGKMHPRGHAFRGGRGAYGVHGEATVRRKDGFSLATWQRGHVTGRSGTTLTVRSDDGATWTWTADAKTRIRKDGDSSALSGLKNGDQVLVFGERSGNTRTAKLVRVPRKR